MSRNITLTATYSEASRSWLPSDATSPVKLPPDLGAGQKYGGGLDSDWRRQGPSPDPGWGGHKAEAVALGAGAPLLPGGEVGPREDGPHSHRLGGDTGPHEPVGPALVGPRHAAHTHAKDDARHQAAYRHEGVLLELLHAVLLGAALRHAVYRYPLQLGRLCIRLRRLAHRAAASFDLNMKNQ